MLRITLIVFFPFQFTHPGRGATIEFRRWNRSGGVSIHAPREGCDDDPLGGATYAGVSIHAPREGCDIIIV